MIRIDLNEREAVVLKELLDACLSDLRVEIQATENMGYKEMLKQRKEILLKLLAGISAGEQVTTR